VATWAELAIDACKAARRLRDDHPRSAVSRAYYAAYSGVTNELAKDPGVTFSLGRSNPDHGRLLDYLQQSFAKRALPTAMIDRVRRNLRDLRRERERADYKPDESVLAREAKECLRRAEQVLAELGLPL
jgi:uncharacterized protein (UPF0332 family)